MVLSSELVRVLSGKNIIVSWKAMCCFLEGAEFHLSLLASPVRVGVSLLLGVGLHPQPTV